MNEKLQKICEEILQDENKSKRFIALQTPEEMYDYFKEKVPELTEDEFDSFVVEALDSYIQMQNQEPEAITEALDSVSGGINFGKFSKQIVAGAMAMLSLGSATMASNTQKTNFGGNINTVSTQNTIKQTGKFQKITNWVKNHKAISALIGAGVLVGGTLAVEHLVVNKIIDKYKSKVDMKKVDKAVEEILKDIKDDEFKNSAENFHGEFTFPKMDIEDLLKTNGVVNVKIQTEYSADNTAIYVAQVGKNTVIPKTVKSGIWEKLHAIQNSVKKHPEVIRFLNLVPNYLKKNPDLEVSKNEETVIIKKLFEKRKDLAELQSKINTYRSAIEAIDTLLECRES